MFKKISQNFVKSPLKFCLISQILVNSLWHVCTVKTLVGISIFDGGKLEESEGYNYIFVVFYMLESKQISSYA